MPEELLRRITLLLGVTMIFNVLGLFILSIAESGNPSLGFEDLLFEQISAFGTVGLSTGITSSLSAVGKLWITITMLVGRLGPLTLGGFLILGREDSIKFPKEHILLG